jgi:hypothetical protein
MLKNLKPILLLYIGRRLWSTVEAQFLGDKYGSNVFKFYDTVVPVSPPRHLYTPSVAGVADLRLLMLFYFTPICS